MYSKEERLVEISIANTLGLSPASNIEVGSEYFWFSTFRGLKCYR